MKTFLIPLLILFSLSLSSCDTQHRGQTIIPFTGDYRYHKGIAEFYDCKSRVKYFVAKSGTYQELQTKYSSLSITDGDDVYMEVEGYTKTEELLDGIGSLDVFVVTKLIVVDQNRGCDKARRVGH